MIEIVVCLIIWFWGLTSLWLNVILTCLLYIRFSWRVMLTVTKYFNSNKEKEEEVKEDGR